VLARCRFAAASMLCVGLRPLCSGDTAQHAPQPPLSHSDLVQPTWEGREPGIYNHISRYERTACGYGFRAPSRSLSSGRPKAGPVGSGPGMTRTRVRVATLVRVPMRLTHFGSTYSVRSPPPCGQGYRFWNFRISSAAWRRGARLCQDGGIESDREQTRIEVGTGVVPVVFGPCPTDCCVSNIFQKRFPCPCGEGLGVGVMSRGTGVALCSTPLPSPPPQGGREQTDYAACADSTSTKRALVRAG
jgi:hypothetical protein